MKNIDNIIGFRNDIAEKFAKLDSNQVAEDFFKLEIDFKKLTVIEFKFGV